MTEIPRRLRRRGKTAVKAPTKEKTVKKAEEYKDKIPSLTNEGLPETFFERIVKTDVNKDSQKIASQKVNEFEEKHERLPQPAEIDEISEQVFGQLKEDYERKMKEDREELKKKSLLEREKKKVKQALEREEKKLDREELNLKDEKTDTTIEVPKPEHLAFEEVKQEEKLSITEVESIKPLEEAGAIEGTAADDSETLITEIETEKNKCPKCGTKTDRLIFCPKCNNGFCPHCAAEAKQEGNNIVYKCPSCNYSFKSPKEKITE